MTASTPRLLLSESATILETILGTAPVGLGVLDRELRFVRVEARSPRPARGFGPQRPR